MSEKASNPINLNRIKAYRYGLMVRPAGIEPASFGVLVHIFALNDFNSFKGESYIKQGFKGFKK